MNLLSCLLPFLVGCGWFGMLAARPNKTLAIRLLAIMALLSGFYFLFDAIIFLASKEFDPLTLVYASLFNTLVGPLLPIAAIVFFISQIKLEQHASARWFLILVPYVCYTFCAFMVTQLLGFDRAADYVLNKHMMPGQLFQDQILAYKTFEFVVYEMFRWVVVFNYAILLFVIIYALAVSDFKLSVIGRALFKSGPMRPYHVVGILFIFLIAQSYFRFSHTGLWIMRQQESVAMMVYSFKAVTIFFIGLFGYQCQKPAVYLMNKHNTPHFDDLPMLKAKTHWREESIEDEYSLPILQSDFNHLMHEKQCYRRPGLNIFSVAHELGVTPNALNHMVKSVYGVNYNTYVKVQRVAFARRYHQANPSFPAETVAMESGFRSASIMRQHFKEAAYVIQKNEE